MRIFDVVHIIRLQSDQHRIELPRFIKWLLFQMSRFHKEGVLFIDVNSPSGYKAGHIPGAVALDVTAMTESNLAEHAAKDRMVVFYCAHPGRWGAAVASAKAIVWGYTNVLFYEGGTAAWSQAGYPIEKG